jgi:transcriptional regulator with XRE-family HTH domain
MEVGKKIKAYLDSHGISQTFVARKTGISVQQLNLSLNGSRRIPLEEYELICGALEVNVDEFLEPRKLED